MNYMKRCSLTDLPNQNDFVTVLHEGGIVVVVQEENEQDGDNNDNDANTDEYPDRPPGISLETAEAYVKISGVPPPENLVEIPGVVPPENPVELTRVVPPENEVDENFIPPLFSNDYDR